MESPSPNESIDHTRRTAIKALGAGALGLLATGQARAQTPFQDELDAVRAATEKYRTVGAALEAGFQPGGPYVPGMGWHWMHPERIQKAAQNGPSREQPQLLVYADTNPGSADGHLVLGAVEWALPVGAQGYTEDNQPDLFSTDHEHWHVHHSRRHLFASGDGQQTNPESLSVAQLLQRGRWAEVPPDMEVQPGDEVTADWGFTGATTTRTVDLAPDPHPDLLTLHAWVHLQNRDHVLSAFNKNLMYVEMLPSAIMSERTAKPGSE